MALGCSKYNARITRRGGRGEHWNIPFTSLNWERSINNRSSAGVDVDGLAGIRGTRCCSEFERIVPWRDELRILRNDETVWVGPVISKGTDNGGGHINAVDLSTWFKRRIIHIDHDYTQVDLSTIFNNYARDALGVDNSMRLTVAASLCGVLGDRRVLAAQYAQAWTVMAELAGTGVDWTMLGRQMIVGGFELDQTPIGTVTDSVVSDLEGYSMDGTPFTTDQYVIGDGNGEAGATIVGRKTGSALAAQTYGVHELVSVETEIRDVDSAHRRAQTIYDLHSAPVRSLSGVSLHESFPLSANQLIAGRALRVKIDQLCEPIGGLTRIVGVTGSFGPEHDRVSLSFGPLGSSRLVGASGDSNLDAGSVIL